MFIANLTHVPPTTLQLTTDPSLQVAGLQEQHLLILYIVVNLFKLIELTLRTTLSLHIIKPVQQVASPSQVRVQKE